MNEQQEFYNLLTRKLEELQSKIIKIEENFVIHNVEQKVQNETNCNQHKEMTNEIKEVQKEIEPLVEGIKAFSYSKKFLLGIVIFIGAIIGLIISIKQLFR